MNAVERAVDVLERGGLAVVPTDTVYGLVCRAELEQSACELYRLKGREAIQPTAVIVASVASLLELFELEQRTTAIVRSLLPGPFTLVVPDPTHRFGWLSPGRPDTIGVRVPVLPEATAEIVARVGAIVATSANLPGELDPHTLAEVPVRIRSGVGAVLDGGALPGTPSTVVDLTGLTPVVLRAGAGDPTQALHALTSALTESLPPRDLPLTGEE